MTLQQLMTGAAYIELTDRMPDAQASGCIFLAFVTSCMTLFFQVRSFCFVLRLRLPWSS